MDDDEESATAILSTGTIAAGAGLGLAAAADEDDAEAEDAAGSPLDEVAPESGQAPLLEADEDVGAIEPEPVAEFEPVATSELETIRGTPEAGIDADEGQDAAALTPDIDEDSDEIDLPTEEEATVLLHRHRTTSRTKSTFLPKKKLRFSQRRPGTSH